MSHIETEVWVQVTIRKCKYVRDTDQTIYVDWHTLEPLDKEEEQTETNLSISAHYSLP
jgi:hypothetical protein